MHLLWPNFVFMTATISWIIVANRHPTWVYGSHPVDERVVFRKITPWVLGVIALVNGILWVSPLFR